MTTMLAHPDGQQTDNNKYTDVLKTIAELHECERRAKELRDLRDRQLRDLHQAGDGESVSALRRCTGLSKSMLRLIVNPPRWTPTDS